MKHWSTWLIIGGLAIDFIDAFTDKDGNGGIFYGPGKILAKFDNGLPGGLHPGELIAAIGVAGMYFK